MYVNMCMYVSIRMYLHVHTKRIHTYIHTYIQEEPSIQDALNQLDGIVPVSESESHSLPQDSSKEEIPNSDGNTGEDTPANISDLPPDLTSVDAAVDNDDAYRQTDVGQDEDATDAVVEDEATRRLKEEFVHAWREKEEMKDLAAEVKKRLVCAGC
jgi:hypothetical protein